jgi:hypothetical protein
MARFLRFGGKRGECENGKAGEREKGRRTGDMRIWKREIGVNCQ